MPDFTQPYLVGLSLGKPVDRRTLAILELEWRGDSFDYAESLPSRKPIVRLVRADWFPLGLLYSGLPAMLADVVTKLERRPAAGA